MVNYLRIIWKGFIVSIVFSLFFFLDLRVFGFAVAETTSFGLTVFILIFWSMLILIALLLIILLLQRRKKRIIAKLAEELPAFQNLEKSAILPVKKEEHGSISKIRDLLAVMDKAPTIFEKRKIYSLIIIEYHGLNMEDKAKIYPEIIKQVK
ncbi:hypothetical protein J4468_01175 [Candidatus Woesearchaeota archaeon]|nr:hypothetical protein [Candidatus Woesearchaeota archaeon]